MSCHDPVVRQLARELQAACLQPVQDVRFPFRLLDPEHEKRQALSELREAMTRGDDEAIVRAWLPLLEQYGPAQSYRERAELARRRLEALARLRQAIAQRSSLEDILASYDAVLDGCSALTEREQLLITEGRRFRQALQERHDKGLLAAATNLISLYGPTILNAQEQAQVQAARERYEAARAWAEARRSGEVSALAAATSRCGAAASPCRQRRR